jgi:polyhydroxybutyrate depolymerase
MSIRIAAGVLVCAVLLAACGDTRHLRVDGATRSYRLHVPDTCTDGQPVPLLLALHQFSDTARGMERLTGFNAIADREGFIVAYPQGRFRIWRVGEEADVAFLDALIDALSAEYPIDPERIYATGASAGGMMIQYYACRGGRLAAIAPVMGSMEQANADACADSARLPVLLIHGDADPVVPFGGGETPAGPGMRPVFLSAPENAAFWAARNGCGPDPRIEEIVHPVGGDRALRSTWDCPEAPVVFYQVVGGGHTWPGRHNRYPAFITGPTSQAIDASETVWGFLAGLAAAN